MTRLEKAIEEVKSIRTMKNKAWIFDDNGNIKADVFVGDILPLMEEWKDYEVEADEELMDYIREEYDKADNSYNWGANISNDFNYHTKKIDNEYYYLVMVHLFGDVRGNYSTEFVLKYDYEDGLFGADSIYQIKDINDSYVADICILNEGITIQNQDTYEEVGVCYEIELQDILKFIEKKGE